MSFDNVKVGELQAEAILDVVPEGNFIIIKGNSADANADFLRAGIHQCRHPGCRRELRHDHHRR